MAKILSYSFDILTILGVICIVIGAFMLAKWLGMVTLGFALLLTATLVRNILIIRKAISGGGD